MGYGFINIPSTQSGYYSINNVPSQSGTLTYNGKDQTPTWNFYDTDKLKLDITAQKNVGTYTATFTPIAPYIWADGDSNAKSVSWTIAKANSSFTLSATSVSLNTSSLSKAVTVTKTGTTGVVTATSSNSSVATVAVSSNTITITAVKSGSATITVKVAEDSNYNAPANKTIAVTCDVVSTTLADNTPAKIKEISQAGQAANYWKPGDTIDIPINGTVASLAINGTYKATIIGINHNQSLEGSGIHFIIGKNANNQDIAFCDSHYGECYNGFSMNINGVCSQGWRGSYMRNTICSAFLSALPTEWRNAISSCTKYSVNLDGLLQSNPVVSSTDDMIFLLSVFEVLGYSTQSFSAEQNFQAQYEYYKNGNSKVRYRHDSAIAVNWWTRSVASKISDYYCYIASDDNNNMRKSDTSFGFAPAFKV